jgi:transposase, IS30 family
MAQQLTLWEREQIAQFRSQQLSKAEIARQLGRHRSTIGRELTRNSDGPGYWASSAQKKAQARRKPRARKLDDERLNEYVRHGLVRCWSPEQIAGRSRRDFCRQPRRCVSHSTVYRWIASDVDRQHWESFLRFGRRRLEPETRGKLPARAEIAGRPAVVDERRRFGDWEGDTVVGKQRRGGLVTLVERKSGFGLVAKVQRLKARNVARSAKRQLAPLPRGLRHTATFDNGKEFANHERIAQATGIDIYFARPYHAWERGSNESFNGLLRQFFPKGTDFTGISPLEVKHVHGLLNDRPRKRLGYRTPREVLGRYFPVAFQM